MHMVRSSLPEQGSYTIHFLYNEMPEQNDTPAFHPYSAAALPDSYSGSVPGLDYLYSMYMS